MTTAQNAARWPITSTAQSVMAAPLIHGRLTRTDEYTLCERDGGLLPWDSVTLILDEVTPENASRPVDCPKCLEWMHA